MLTKHEVIGSSPIVSIKNKNMRSRILCYQKNVATYDFLTQFIVQNSNKTPTFSFSEIQIKNLRTNDTKQVCLNLVSIQLVGNNHVLCKSQKDILNLSLKSIGNHAYFVLENVVLLFYKNKLQKPFLSQNKLRVRGKNFINIVEYFTLDSKLLNFLENTSNKHLKIILSFQICNSKDTMTTLYFLKSLGFPCE
uniref:Ribosomal protein L5 n=1 Tax=Pyropia kanakaensis TaxID=139729 RepID=A0A060D787_9RHOD|nr:hypothetical protein [Pyropia kanakaensis]